MPVIDFIENKYEEYLTAESRVQRKAITDTRVHCCLYFIAPSGHGLKPLDVEFMQRLCDKVNIIPVIAKADTMTPEEVALFKKQVSKKGELYEELLEYVLIYVRTFLLDSERDCSAQDQDLRFPRATGERGRGQGTATAPTEGSICGGGRQYGD